LDTSLKRPLAISLSTRACALRAPLLRTCMHAVHAEGCSLVIADMPAAHCTTSTARARWCPPPRRPLASM
jgi:hypothetical protein